MKHGIILGATFAAFAALGWAPWAVREHLSRRLIGESPPNAAVGSIGSLRCQAGPCYLRRAGSFALREIPTGGIASFSYRDDALSLNEKGDLRLKLRFGTTAQVLGIGVVSSVEGDRNVTADVAPVKKIVDATAGGKEAKPPEEKKEKAVDAPILFLGDVEIRLRSPLPGTHLFARRFPVKFPFSFSITAKTSPRPIELDQLERWQLVRLDVANGPRFLGPVRLERVPTGKLAGDATTLPPDLYEYFVDLEIPGAGSFGLIPSNRPVAGKEVRARFDVEALNGHPKGQEKMLRDQLRKNLDILNEGGEPKPVFIE